MSAQPITMGDVQSDDLYARMWAAITKHYGSMGESPGPDDEALCMDITKVAQQAVDAVPGASDPARIQHLESRLADAEGKVKGLQSQFRDLWPAACQVHVECGAHFDRPPSIGSLERLRAVLTKIESAAKEGGGPR